MRATGLPTACLRNPAALLVLVGLFGAGGAAGAADRILLGTAGANAGTAGVSLDVNITHDEPIHACSLAVTFNPEVLALRKITDEGTAIASLEPEFFYPTINNESGTAVLGVIFSYNADDYQQVALEASPDLPQQVAVLTFDIAPGAPPGDYPIELTNGIGSPPISNVFSREGQTIRPALGDGIVTVNNQNILLIDSANLQPGSRFEVSTSGKHPEPLQGFSVAFTYDKTILSFVEATFAGTAVAQVLKPQTIEFFQSQVEMDFDTQLARMTVGAIVD